jgi:hypothetical protein
MSNVTTTLRILDDISGTENLVDIERDRGELIISLLHVALIIRRQEPVIRLTIHLRHELITLHWWAIDEFLNACRMPDRVLGMLIEGRVGA